MANTKSFLHFFNSILAKAFILSFIFILCISSLGSSFVVTNDEHTKVYIVYLGSLPQEPSLLSEQHLHILQQVVEDRSPEQSLIRSYKRSFNGFAAKLTYKEMKHLENMEGVVSLFPSKNLKLQTTRSWDFMGFPETTQSFQSTESNIILGVLDSGIWPDSPSFSDDGFGPAPAKWKGVCDGGQNFTCNNKIIGARTYFETALDNLGHGSHTASTAAGRKVDNVSFYDLAKGSARGGAPFARIAVYKVCDINLCSESDIMAGFDDAIADGVNLITISIGGGAMEIYKDTIAIASFHAMEKGILTVQSAGNSGNHSGTVSSNAPWLFTVAASSMDRQIISKVALGDGTTLIGKSVNPFILKGDKFPLVYGKASSQCTEELAKLCTYDCLDSSLVKGKIVVCDKPSGIFEAHRAGALGALARSAFDDVSFVPPMPGAWLRATDYMTLLSYINSTISPEANIYRSECTKDTTAPVVASFSSRGPNTIASDILKPDITAPGIDILAAFSPVASVSSDPEDKRSVKYSVLSGTSMSCPHIAGVAAYLKSLHPDWSPAAIKSALMTTAHPMDPSKNPDAEFGYGSGHVDPMKAANPGLIYEAAKQDYVQFLCNLGYDDSQVRLITGDKTSSCTKKFDSTLTPKDVNYPSMSAKVEYNMPFNVKFHRTVTNIGAANSTYVATVESGSSLKVTVEPSSLSFGSLNEQKSFDVIVEGEALSSELPVSAALAWSDGTYTVRSPIVMYTTV